MSESNYIDCPKCKKKYHIKAGSICPHCKTDREKYQEKQIKTETEHQRIKEAKEQKEVNPQQEQPTATPQKKQQPNKKSQKCKDCGEMVSKKASSCPHCGSPLQRKPIGCLGGIFIFFLLCFIIGLIGGNSSDTNSSTSTSTKKKTQVETRDDRIKKGFSAWDGSHYALVKVIKKSMNDPDSYEHDETVYWDQGDHLIVKTTFRGRNAFGGMVKNWVKAKADLNGNILQVLEQDP